MIQYTLKRIGGAIPTLLILAAATFFLLRFAPGGPFDTERAFPPEVQAAIEAKYGFDQPLLSQFVGWLADVARGDLHESFQYVGRPVTEILAESLPTSVQLGMISLFFSLCIGFPLGALAAWKQNTFWDFGAVFLTVAGISLPSYLVASLLILVFSIWLGWLPPALWEDTSSMILPVLTLSTRPMALIARLTRSSTLEALASDYVRTAYAKGLPSIQVVFKHALRNSLVPVLTLLGPITANLLTGSFLVEVVFQIPGLGRHFVNAVMNRDYPLVMGITLLYGVVLIGCNLAVDLAYAWVDPRIRVGSKNR
jgi:oligopeptide transport system permease protein